MQPQTQQLLSQIPGNPWKGLQNADRIWTSLRENTQPVPCVVRQNSQPLGETDWDVVISGGTLGILLGAALARQNWRVAVVERGILKGRQQEWNISREELRTFVEMGLLTEEELERSIATEYNPGRVSFRGGSDIWVRDVLNIGVDPVYLLETLKQQFLKAGGTLLEQTNFDGSIVHPDGVRVNLTHPNLPSEAEGENSLTTRLLVDAMGHFSPISQQVRGRQKPDAVCLVVGTCAEGYSENETGDLFVSFTPILHHCQYFWEAFPAKDGRTTYLFTYLDAHPDRFSLKFFFDEYLRLLPEYQQVELESLDFKRALFGFFPSYRNSPLQSPWNRILPVGDSSGSQSPLSFGGFGAMVRHLKRLSEGVGEALNADCLDRSALSLLQPYQPNLSVTWMFQQTMSVGIDEMVTDPESINRLLASVFEAMQEAGDEVLRPFLKDVVQFGSLSQALLRTSVSAPLTVTKILPKIGFFPLLGWMRHYVSLGAYSALSPIGKAIDDWSQTASPQQRYYLKQWSQAWQYGSGKE
ncbi:FAD-dependent oxidoreductase [Baaleninema sp.]|uniref:FAD-dependent oxidoreductase n=1 Tax=Baaleninema sp. TaxID=3101197 RepID=UPI003D0059BE